MTKLITFPMKDFQDSVRVPATSIGKPDSLTPAVELQFQHEASIESTHPHFNPSLAIKVKLASCQPLYNYSRAYGCASCTQVFAVCPHLSIPISTSSVTLCNTQASIRAIVHVCSIGKTGNLIAPTCVHEKSMSMTTTRHTAIGIIMPCYIDALLTITCVPAHCILQRCTQKLECCLPCLYKQLHFWAGFHRSHWSCKVPAIHISNPHTH